MSQSAMGNDDYEEWRDVMEVLEERDREWWAEEIDDEEWPVAVPKTCYSSPLDLDLRSYVIGAPANSGGNVVVAPHPTRRTDPETGLRRVAGNCVMTISRTPCAGAF